MNKFEEYNSSQIAPQCTLLQKFKRLLDYLKSNPTYNIYKSTASYADGRTIYSISNIELRQNEIKKGDAVVFDNAYLGFVESVGDTTITVLSACLIKGQKGEKGEKGETGKITDVLELLSFFEGSETIVIDLSEDNEHIEIHLDAEVIAKIENSLQLPLTHTERKIVAVDTTGGQEMLGIGDGISVEDGKLKAIGGGLKLYKHTFTAKAWWQSYSDKSLNGVIISTSNLPISNDETFYTLCSNAIKVNLKINGYEIFLVTDDSRILFGDNTMTVHTEGLSSIYELSNINDIVTEL